ncbi:hypothetical protein M6D93_15130 [Jatrophihabitans telluris]|uniref:ABC transporter permease n=1 Tax=Jatrophihabitans telluris TaxID=2038343 RepID=A0ABY4QXJ3_9ACTN|nr:hypothetical protein [Jatrophihabitans telluris]UQX87624.1 hypothetical protein M6D93_15130 [Jatrophihabitans telluris]
MTHPSLRLRFWIEAGLTLLFAVAVGLTLARAAWIELLFKVDPDHGSGLSEAVITIALGVAALVLAVTARREWMRPRSA